MAIWDDVKRTAKNLALQQHKNDSDEMLQQIVKRNLDHVLANNGLSDADMIFKARLAGEGEGCIQIINSRRAMDADYKEKNQKWRREQPDRKAKAILNLPNAATLNGQLVAAILEEVPDGLTQKQIASWCDELEAIPEEDFKALLDGLVKEKIIELDEKGRYSLLSVLDRDMQISGKAGGKKVKGEPEAVLYLYAYMHANNEPVSDLEYARLLGDPENESLRNGIKAAFWRLVMDDVATAAFGVRLDDTGKNVRPYYTLKLLGEEVLD